MIDLSGLHLLVTRPESQAQVWAQQLKALGAQVSCQPFLVIQALKKPEAQQAITDRLLHLDEYQHAIFVSQNAVELGVEWIDRYWPQLPVDIEFLAVGSATAALLQNKLTRLGVSVEAPKQAMNSETLVALPNLQDIEGHKILIFRGCGGRSYLQQVLTQRGASVDYCELYQRVIPESIDSNTLKSFCHTTLAPITTVHSGETLENLLQAVANIDSDTLSWIQQQPLLLPGERVANLARDLGFTTIIVAENATHNSMIEALNDWRLQH